MRKPIVYKQNVDSIECSNLWVKLGNGTCSYVCMMVDYIRILLNGMEYALCTRVGAKVGSYIAKLLAHLPVLLYARALCPLQ